MYIHIHFTHTYITHTHTLHTHIHCTHIHTLHPYTHYIHTTGTVPNADASPHATSAKRTWIDDAEHAAQAADFAVFADENLIALGDPEGFSGLGCMFVGKVCKRRDSGAVTCESSLLYRDDSHIRDHICESSLLHRDDSHIRDHICESSLYKRDDSHIRDFLGCIFVGKVGMCV